MRLLLFRLKVLNPFYQWDSSRKIGECLFDKLVFGFNQAKQWKKQVYGTLHRNSWYRDIEAEIILVF